MFSVFFFAKLKVSISISPDGDSVRFQPSTAVSTPALAASQARGLEPV